MSGTHILGIKKDASVTNRDVTGKAEMLLRAIS